MHCGNCGILRLVVRVAASDSGVGASHACAAAHSHGAALSLSKKRNGTRLVKDLAKCRRFLKGSFGNGLLRRLIAADNDSYMLRTAT